MTLPQWMVELTLDNSNFVSNMEAARRSTQEFEQALGFLQYNGFNALQSMHEASSKLHENFEKITGTVKGAIEVFAQFEAASAQLGFAARDVGSNLAEANRMMAVLTSGDTLSRLQAIESITAGFQSKLGPNVVTPLAKGLTGMELSRGQSVDRVPLLMRAFTQGNTRLLENSGLNIRLSQIKPYLQEFQKAFHGGKDMVNPDAMMVEMGKNIKDATKNIAAGALEQSEAYTTGARTAALMVMGMRQLNLEYTAWGQLQQLDSKNAGMQRIDNLIRVDTLGKVFAAQRMYNEELKKNPGLTKDQFFASEKYKEHMTAKTGLTPTIIAALKDAHLITQDSEITKFAAIYEKRNSSNFNVQLGTIIDKSKEGAYGKNLGEAEKLIARLTQAGKDKKVAEGDLKELTNLEAFHLGLSEMAMIGLTFTQSGAALMGLLKEQWAQINAITQDIMINLGRAFAGGGDVNQTPLGQMLKGVIGLLGVIRDAGPGFYKDTATAMGLAAAITGIGSASIGAVFGFNSLMNMMTVAGGMFTRIHGAAIGLASSLPVVGTKLGDVLVAQQEDYKERAISLHNTGHNRALAKFNTEKSELFRDGHLSTTNFNAMTAADKEVQRAAYERYVEAGKGADAAHAASMANLKHAPTTPTGYAGLVTERATQSKNYFGGVAQNLREGTTRLGGLGKPLAPMVDLFGNLRAVAISTGPALAGLATTMLLVSTTMAGVVIAVKAVTGAIQYFHDVSNDVTSTNKQEPTYLKIKAALDSLHESFTAIRGTFDGFLASIGIGDGSAHSLGASLLTMAASIMSAVKPAIEWFTLALAKTINGFKFLSEQASNIPGLLTLLKVGLYSVAAALIAVAAASALTPWGAIIAAAGVIGLGLTGVALGGNEGAAIKKGQADASSEDARDAAREEENRKKEKVKEDTDKKQRELEAKEGGNIEGHIASTGLFPKVAPQEDNETIQQKIKRYKDAAETEIAGAKSSAEVLGIQQNLVSVYKVFVNDLQNDTTNRIIAQKALQAEEKKVAQEQIKLLTEANEEYKHQIEARNKLMDLELAMIETRVKGFNEIGGDVTSAAKDEADLRVIRTQEALAKSHGNLSVAQRTVATDMEALRIGTGKLGEGLAALEHKIRMDTGKALEYLALTANKAADALINKPTEAPSTGVSSSGPSDVEKVVAAAKSTLEAADKQVAAFEAMRVKNPDKGNTALVEAARTAQAAAVTALADAEKKAAAAKAETHRTGPEDPFKDLRVAAGKAHKDYIEAQKLSYDPAYATVISNAKKVDDDARKALVEAQKTDAQKNHEAHAAKIKGLTDTYQKSEVVFQKAKTDATGPASPERLRALDYARRNKDAALKVLKDAEAQPKPVVHPAAGKPGGKSNAEHAESAQAAYNAHLSNVMAKGQFNTGPDSGLAAGSLFGASITSEVRARAGQLRTRLAVACYRTAEDIAKQLGGDLLNAKPDFSVRGKSLSGMKADIDSGVLKAGMVVHMSRPGLKPGEDPNSLLSSNKNHWTTYLGKDKQGADRFSDQTHSGNHAWTLGALAAAFPERAVHAYHNPYGGRLGQMVSGGLNVGNNGNLSRSGLTGGDMGSLGLVGEALTDQRNKELDAYYAKMAQKKAIPHADLSLALQKQQNELEVTTSDRGLGGGLTNLGGFFTQSINEAKLTREKALTAPTFDPQALYAGLKKIFQTQLEEDYKLTNAASSVPEALANITAFIDRNNQQIAELDKQLTPAEAKFNTLDKQFAAIQDRNKHSGHALTQGELDEQASIGEARNKAGSEVEALKATIAAKTVAVHKADNDELLKLVDNAKKYVDILGTQADFLDKMSAISGNNNAVAKLEREVELRGQMVDAARDSLNLLIANKAPLAEQQAAMEKLYEAEVKHRMSRGTLAAGTDKTAYGGLGELVGYHGGEAKFLDEQQAHSADLQNKIDQQSALHKSHSKDFDADAMARMQKEKQDTDEDILKRTQEIFARPLEMQVKLSGDYTAWADGAGKAVGDSFKNAIETGDWRHLGEQISDSTGKAFRTGIGTMVSDFITMPITNMFKDMGTFFSKGGKDLGAALVTAGKLTNEQLSTITQGVGVFMNVMALGAGLWATATGSGGQGQQKIKNTEEIYDSATTIKGTVVGETNIGIGQLRQVFDPVALSMSMAAASLNRVALLLQQLVSGGGLPAGALPTSVKPGATTQNVITVNLNATGTITVVADIPGMQKQLNLTIQDTVKKMVQTELGKQLSDRRLKRNIVHLTTLTNGLKVYSWNYLWSDTVYVGVMAQEVALIVPEALLTDVNGYLGVDYSLIGMDFLTADSWVSS
jgi:hypothetical protein